MLKLLRIFIFLTVNQLSLAQSEISFNVQSTDGTFTYETLILEDNSSIEVYSSINSASQFRLHLRRKNSQGMVSLNQSYLTNEIALSTGFVACIIPTINEGFIVMSLIDGTTISLISFDQNNEISWSKKMLMSDFSFILTTKLIADGEGGGYIGISDYYFSTFLRFDSEGTILWAKKPPTTFSNGLSINDMFLKENGNLICLASGFSDILFTNISYYFEISPTSIILSKRENTNSNIMLRVVVETESNELIVAGMTQELSTQILVQKLNALGEVVISKRIQYAINDVYDMKIDADGKIYILIVRGVGLQVVKLNSDLSLNSIFSVGGIVSGFQNLNYKRDAFVALSPENLCFKTFSSNNYGQILIDYNGNLSETCNTFLAISGGIFDDTTGLNYQNATTGFDFDTSNYFVYPFAYVLTETQNFVATQNYCDYILAIDEINNSKEANDLKVFPNPSNGEFFIANSSSSSIQEIKAFNSIGKQIELITQVGEKYWKINLIDSEPGTYFLKITLDDGTSYLNRIISRSPF